MEKRPDLYFIALLPPPDLRETVRRLKEEMRDRFGAGHALKSPAHITLQMPFKRSSGSERRLAEGLAEFAGRQSPFTIRLSGFDCFAPRVLFVRVDNHRPVQKLHERLKRVLIRPIGLKPDELNERVHPHLTIATRDLRKAAFREAWAEFKERPFVAAFEVQSLFLLKHNGRRWEVFREFPFS